MQFKDIVGQKKNIDELVRITQSGHLPHAILLLAKKGWGGLPLGIALAQYLMCDQPTDDSCGKCTNCQMMNKLSHPDVAYTFPTVKLPKYTDNLSEYFIEEFREFVIQTPYDNVQKWLQFINAENSQGNISADQCRKIMDFFALKSYQGNKKIHIIWLPEYLGKEGNILLKLIEEPPADSIMIFVSEQEHMILGTIRSRLQKFELKPILPEDISQSLQIKFGKDNSQANSISRLAAGDYEKAIELAHESTNDLLPMIEEFIRNIYTNKGVDMVTWVENMAKLGRETIKSILQYIQDIYTNAMHIQYGLKTIHDMPADEQALLNIILQSPINIEIIEKIKTGLQDTQYAISRNAHAKTQLLNLNIEMQYWIKNRALTIV